MDSNYNDCDYFNLKNISLPDEICSVIISLKEEYIVFGVFILFITYATYHKIKGSPYKSAGFSPPKIRTINASSSFQKIIIIMFFSNLLFFILFY